MAIMKRVGAQVGGSRPGGNKTATEGTICPHCSRQTTMVPVGGKFVCQLCGKAPGDR